MNRFLHPRGTQTLQWHLRATRRNLKTFKRENLKFTGSNTEKFSLFFLTDNIEVMFGS